MYIKKHICSFDSERSNFKMTVSKKMILILCTVLSASAYADYWDGRDPNGKLRVLPQPGSTSNKQYQESDGTLRGSSHTDYFGNKKYYDADGNLVGSSKTNYFGDKKYYDERGNLIGRED